MYRDFYGLKLEPFAVTSDPSFLWMGAGHEEAFAHISFAVRQKKGFALLTGEIGTGKTTLLNELLNQLDESFVTSVVFNPVLSLDALFQYIFKDFGIGEAPANRGDALSVMYTWLAEQAQAGRTPVIVIDEAQSLPDESLEGLRLLSNFETATTKLVQIVLVGQPELRDRLKQEHLRQINQRISIQFHLRGLELASVPAYITHRLQVAGAPQPDKLFSRQALELIAAESEGIPRVINQLCDLSLLKGYSKGEAMIGDTLVEEVIHDEFSGRRAPQRAVDSSRNSASGARAQAEAAAVRNWLPWLLSAGAVAVAAWFALRPTDSVQPAQNTGDTRLVTQVEARSEAKLDSAAQRIQMLESQLQQQQRSLAEVQDSLRLAQAGEEKLRRERKQQLNLAQQRDEQSETRPARLAEPGKEVKVQLRANDTLVKIAAEYYGRNDWTVIQKICAANPHIENPNFIRAGDVIVLPMQ